VGFVGDGDITSREPTLSIKPGSSLMRTGDQELICVLAYAPVAVAEPAAVIHQSSPRGGGGGDQFVFHGRAAGLHMSASRVRLAPIPACAQRLLFRMLPLPLVSIADGLAWPAVVRPCELGDQLYLRTAR